MRAILAAAVLLLAGCLSAGGERPDYEAAEEAANLSAAPFLLLDHGTDLGHRDASAHAGAFNVELAGYHNGMPGDGQDPDAITPGMTYNEFAVTDEYAYVARSFACPTDAAGVQACMDGAENAVGGFVILSHKDPADPARLTYVGEFDALPGADLEVSDDETLAFFATQRNQPHHLAASGAGSQTGGSVLPRGILVVDIADKKAPALESYTPLPANGPHTITYHRHKDGNEYLIACTYDLITDPATGAIVSNVPATQRVIVYQVQRSPSQLPFAAPASLTPVSQFQLTDSAPAGKLYFPHDTRVQVHPTHGGGEATLMYVAYWDKGVRILDFSDPSSLSEVGFFTEFGPTALNNIHLAQAFDEPLGDDRHVTVAEPEIISAPDETGQITFLDTSDPAHPTQLGYWTLPNGTQGQLGVTAFDYSPHNFDLWDGKVALGHNHAGVWVIDVSDEENLRDPKTVGYYMPAKPRTNAPTAQPSVWGVFEHGGLLWASDASTGLYALRYVGP